MGYVLEILLVVVLIGVVKVAIDKSNKKCAEVVAQLTEEQKARLNAAEVRVVEGKKNCWVQEAMIAKATDKGSKYYLYMLYCNKTIDNNTAGNIVNADVSISKADYEAKGLSEGSFVDMEIDAEKAKAVIL